MTNIKLGDKVVRDAATQNHGKVCGGDCAPVFRPVTRAGDKVALDTATQTTARSASATARRCSARYSCRRQSGPGHNHCKPWQSLRRRMCACVSPVTPQ